MSYRNIFVVFVAITMIGLVHFSIIKLVDSFCLGKLSGNVTKEVNTYKKPKEYVCYIIWMIAIVILINLCGSLVNTIWEIIGNQQVNKLIFVVALVIYAIGLTMQAFMHEDEINKMSMYNKAIYILRKEYKENTNQTNKNKD
ncbi:MAG: hypothetical protein SO160_02160 [Lachnospiraceae bacterium]|nr:hypothetical protein [Lachnospiraceae bacterium]